MKKIITNNGATLFVNAIKYIKIVSAKNNATNEDDYLVIAVLYDCSSTNEISLDDINILVLNLDENGDGLKTKEEAEKFKDLLECKIDTNWENIFTSEILDDVKRYMNIDTQRKSTMVDISKIKPINN